MPTFNRHLGAHLWQLQELICSPLAHTGMLIFDNTTIHTHTQTHTHTHTHTHTSSLICLPLRNANTQNYTFDNHKYSSTHMPTFSEYKHSHTLQYFCGDLCVPPPPKVELSVLKRIITQVKCACPQHTYNIYIIILHPQTKSSHVCTK